jgi:hypothetical protein
VLGTTLTLTKDTFLDNLAVGGIAGNGGNGGAGGSCGTGPAGQHTIGGTGGNGGQGGQGGQTLGGALYQDDSATPGAHHGAITGTLFQGNAGWGGDGGAGGAGGTAGTGLVYYNGWVNQGMPGGSGGNAGTGGYAQGGSIYSTQATLYVVQSYLDGTGIGGKGGAGGNGGNGGPAGTGPAYGGAGGNAGNGGNGGDANGGAVIFVFPVASQVVDSTIAQAQALNASAGAGGTGGAGGSGSPGMAGGAAGQNGNTGNQGGAYGGGVYDYFGRTLLLAADTIADNRAGWGGGLFSITEDPSVYDTLIAQNTASLDADVAGFFMSQGHNLIGQIGDSGGWVSTDLTGTSANPLNPLLGPPKNNGGPTPTLALQKGSPAIDHGDPNGLVNPITGKPLTQDQRGHPRTINGTMNIGAFEF